jgi:transcriptional regulator with XRE-family HTH domain
MCGFVRGEAVAAADPLRKKDARRVTLGIEKELSEEQSRLVAATIREEIARRRISRQRLADDARISLSTLEKALSGRRPFTLATTIRLEEALGVSLRKGPVGPPSPASLLAGVAPGDLGSYARPAVSWIEGSYLTVRPSFGEKEAVYAYRTEIAWDDGSSRLFFREAERVDSAFTQDGVVSIPNQSGHIYLVTNKFGQYRLITVARPTISGEMHGILTTLLAGRGAQLTPVATPIALVPLRGLKDVEFGRISAGHPCHGAYRTILRRTLDEPFAMFVPG